MAFSSPVHDRKSLATSVFKFATTSQSSPSSENKNPLLSQTPTKDNSFFMPIIFAAALPSPPAPSTAIFIVIVISPFNETMTYATCCEAAKERKSYGRIDPDSCKQISKKSAQR
ncbi:MAG: hypothetical protein Q7J80_07560, partial [Anaerolineales bacterium]|nr:hypothetical protein [Anaerolineales bacterium]